MKEYDAVVIGGGLLGCFAARGLAGYRLKTALLERREDLCTGISRANTAIVYSGYDTKPGTLKTELCVRAARGFALFCEELGVRYNMCGSLMVCFGERGDAVIRDKIRQGSENGVEGLSYLSREDVLALEPNIAPGVFSGLYSRDSGTVLPWELCLAAAGNAADNGVDIFRRAEVTNISREGEGFRIQAGSDEYYARGIINCGGLSADKIHSMVIKSPIGISPDAGDYIVLDTKAAGHISHIIFHEPEHKGKGLTLVPTVGGNILIGPTERPYEQDAGGARAAAGSKAKPGDDMFAGTSLDGLEALRAQILQVMPSLPVEHAIRTFDATRPNPEDKASQASINDFCIVEENDSALISLIGVKTPGLTCANELGVHVSGKLASRLGAAANPGFRPRRDPPARVRDLPFEQREQLIRDNPDYGKIICRCGGITLGEVLDSIRRAPGAVTLDGIKRRAGTGLGRCQGGFCSQSIIETLAGELCCAPEDITKDGEGSYLFSKMATP
ncbi:MAG: FAD-dependent oxidoreductase [Oscillospiraceae bacterium]|nr:FAD-dependent oxidoreductase [Oscillospiraceae bacterium]